uniref:Uncharacterized protein n=1 Tax=Octactis speculum TaxID=3111310 RepID=A0A7S2AJ41_9STRA|mmetsp:Transcript_10627/g.14025  ORF Transcript_10627/g.14025 Transcript_10627/m.14025 type:complete len:879 (+) Transcript_10627:30-2666(+)
MWKLTTAFSRLACLALCSQSVQANVIGIDIGSTFMKVALVQLGVPLEIVTNTISKRKTEVCITFDRGERYFGSDAYGLMSRKPQSSFTKFGRMLGRSMEHATVKDILSQYYSMDMYQNDTRGGLSIKLGDADYSPEELTAMLLGHAKDFTKAFGGKEIRDCVLTVPSFYTFHERLALKNAAEIAKLKVLALIDENTAAALQYGKDRVFEENHTVLYFNMGAASTQVTITTYGSYVGKEGYKNKTIGTFDVIAKAWDENLGGTDFDLKLTNYFADEFNKKSGGEIRDVPRAMAKLRAQATKSKQVLSANSEIPVKINSLHNDVDFTVHITRAKFEQLSQDLFARVTLPISEALAQANLTVADLDGVELLGGGMRIPKIQSILGDFFVDKQLGVHLNADEAMALGAAFHAANLSTAFKVRKTGMTDFTTHAVNVSVKSIIKEVGLLGSLFGTDEAAAEEAKSWSRVTTLFKAQNRFDLKKTIAFHHDHDIICDLTYPDPSSLPPSLSPQIAILNVTGIEAFAKEMAAKGLDKPKIHLTFKLEGRGVTLSKAEATVEEVVAATNESASDTNKTVNESASNETGNETGAEDNATANTSKSKTEKASKKPKKKQYRRELKVEQDFTLPETKARSPVEVDTSLEKLANLNKLDDERHEKEEAKNTLEGFLYATRNRIYDEDELAAKVSTEEQREELLTLVSESADWLDDEGFDESAAVYKAKKKDVVTLSDPIFLRMEEFVARPKAVEATEKRLVDIRALMKKWETTMPQVTADERADVIALLEKSKQWIDEKTEAQEKLSRHEPPAFLVKNLEAQLKPVTTLVTRLSRKPKPLPPKKNKTNSTNGTATKNETASEQEKNETTTDEKVDEPDAEEETSTGSDEL